MFHFAAQTAVTTSLVTPREDFEVNALGAMTLLEELRALRFPIPLLFTSTNKVYGDLTAPSLCENADPAMSRSIPASWPMASMNPAH